MQIAIVALWIVSALVHGAVVLCYFTVGARLVQEKRVVLSTAHKIASTMTILRCMALAFWAALRLITFFDDPSTVTSTGMVIAFALMPLLIAAAIGTLVSLYFEVRDSQ